MSGKNGNTLVVYPEGGLCNRLRAVCSAMAFAGTHKDVRVEVRWVRNAQCGARFKELFENTAAPHNFLITEASFPLRLAILRLLCRLKMNLAGLLAPRLRRTDGRKTLSLKKEKEEACAPSGSAPCQGKHTRPSTARTREARVGRWIFGPGGGQSARIEALLRRHGRLNVATCYEFFPYEGLVSPGSVFRPTEGIQRTIAATTARFGKGTVGLHIRRTDHRKAIAGSPLQAYLDLVERLRAENPALTFYLATDDEAVKQLFLQRYGTACITLQAPLERGTLRGMRAAVADLWCLSRTAGIYGSRHSSYAGTAGELYGAPLVYTDIL